MKQITFYTILLFFVFPKSLFAQDFSYSQFYNASFLYNPALTGHLPSAYRLTSMYRSQWQNIDGGFQNYTFAADANLYSPSSNTLGYGIIVNQEESMNGRLKNTHSLASAAFHISMDGREKYFLSIGFQAGMLSRRYNTANLKFGSGLLGGINEIIESENTVNFDARAGLNLTAYVSKRFSFKLGAAYLHLGGMTEQLINNSTIPSTVVMLGDADFYFNKNQNRLLQPSFIIFSQGGARQFNFGLSYFQSLEGGQKVFGGLHWRVQDAVITNFGIELTNKIRFTFSYDINHSGLASVTRGQGGFELSIGYIGQVARAGKTKNPYERDYFNL